MGDIPARAPRPGDMVFGQGHIWDLVAVQYWQTPHRGLVIRAFVVERVERCEGESRASDPVEGMHAVDHALESCAEAHDILDRLQSEAFVVVADVDVEAAGVVDH